MYSRQRARPRVGAHQQSQTVGQASLNLQEENNEENDLSALQKID